MSNSNPVTIKRSWENLNRITWMALWSFIFLTAMCPMFGTYSTIIYPMSILTGFYLFGRNVWFRNKALAFYEKYLIEE